MSQQGSTCYIKGCGDPATGTGFRIKQPLCERHLAQDRHKARELTKSVQKKLEPLLAKQMQFRMQQQALAVELQEAEDLFESAVDSLMKWKAAVLKRLTERHDQVMENLRHLSVLQDYEREVADAEKGNDFVRIFELSGAIDVECEEMQEDLESKSEDTKGIVRAVGDVSGGLRDLQLLIDRQLSDVMQLCESTNAICNGETICEFQSEISNLPGSSYFLTSCSNTRGFCVNSEGKVIKAESPADDAQSLPQPCLFISFHLECKIDHLLVCSIDGLLKANVQCDLDWRSAIAGLSCDSKRQALYIAQAGSVKVADLSGCVSRVIDTICLGRPFDFWGMTCSSDKILALSKTKTSREVLCIDKDSGQLQSTVTLRGACPTGQVFESVSEVNNTLLITDWSAHKLYKFCMASGQLITTYPTNRSLLDKLHKPSGVVAHRSGLLFVCEHNQHVVRVMRSDGTVLQILGVVGQAGSDGVKLNGPFEMTLVEGCPELLAVYQTGKESIRVFKLRTFSAS